MTPETVKRLEPYIKPNELGFLANDDKDYEGKIIQGFYLGNREENLNLFKKNFQFNFKFSISITTT